MICFGDLNLTYPMEVATDEERMRLVNRLSNNAENLSKMMNEVVSDVGLNYEDFIEKIHILKSEALMLCDPDISDLLFKLHQLSEDGFKSDFSRVDTLKKFDGLVEEYVEHMDVLKASI